MFPSPKKAHPVQATKKKKARKDERYAKTIYQDHSFISSSGFVDGFSRTGRGSGANSGANWRTNSGGHAYNSGGHAYNSDG
jgi:hypothetical protein